jgi:hypothetical protein
MAMKETILALSILLAAPAARAQSFGDLPHFPKPCGGGQCGGPPPSQAAPRPPREAAPEEDRPAMTPEQRRAYEEQMRLHNEGVRDLKEWHRLEKQPDNKGTLEGWLKLATRWNWEGAWIYYGDMAWRMGMEWRAMDGYQHLIAAGCPQYPAACKLATERGDFLHGKLYPPVLAVPSHPYEPGEPPAPAPPALSLAAYQGALEAYQGQRVFILEARKKIEEDEQALSRLTRDQNDQKAQYLKMKAEYEKKPSSKGFESLQAFYKILQEQQQRITEFAAAWAPEKRKNNSELEVIDASIGIAQQQIRTLAANRQ